MLALTVAPSLSRSPAVAFALALAFCIKAPLLPSAAAGS